MRRVIERNRKEFSLQVVTDLFDQVRGGEIPGTEKVARNFV